MFEPRIKRRRTAVGRELRSLREARSDIRPRPLLVHQRSLGNEAFGVLQAKLTLGQPGDKYEQEADRVADAVMSMPEPRVQRQGELEEEEEAQAKPLSGHQLTPVVQRQDEKEEEKLQTKPLAVQLTPVVQKQDEAEEEEEQFQARPLTGQISPLVQRQDDAEEDEAVQGKPLAGQITPLVQRQDETEEEEDLQAKPPASQIKPSVNRKNEMEEEEEQIRARPLAGEITPVVQRQRPAEEEEPLQAKSASGRYVRLRAHEQQKRVQAKMEDKGHILCQQEVDDEEKEYLQAKPRRAPTVGRRLAARIQRVRGAGQPLDPATRAFMEPRFGRSFANVRVHTHGEAAVISRVLNARAFTVGRDVVFGDMQYAPRTREGRKLIAHELTHVVQQGNKNKNRSLAQARRRHSQLMPAHQGCDFSAAQVQLKKGHSPTANEHTPLSKTRVEVEYLTVISNLEEIKQKMEGEPSAKRRLLLKEAYAGYQKAFKAKNRFQLDASYRRLLTLKRWFKKLNRKAHDRWQGLVKMYVKERYRIKASTDKSAKYALKFLGYQYRRHAKIVRQAGKYLEPADLGSFLRYMGQSRHVKHANALVSLDHKLSPDVKAKGSSGIKVFWSLFGWDSWKDFFQDLAVAVGTLGAAAALTVVMRATKLAIRVVKKSKSLKNILARLTQGKAVIKKALTKSQKGRRAVKTLERLSDRINSVLEPLNYKEVWEGTKNNFRLLVENIGTDEVGNLASGHPNYVEIGQTVEKRLKKTAVQLIVESRVGLSPEREAILMNKALSLAGKKASLAYLRTYVILNLSRRLLTNTVYYGLLDPESFKIDYILASKVGVDTIAEMLDDLAQNLARTRMAKALGLSKDLVKYLITIDRKTLQNRLASVIQ